MLNRSWKETAQEIFRGHLGWVLGLFLIGLGAKYQLILNYGSPLPFYDQWEAEAEVTYIPYFEHVLAFVDLFKAHNEHRVFFTRIYDLALLLLNGQWDSRLQMTLSAVIHCAVVAGFGWWAAIKLGRRAWPLLWPPLALILTLPYGWENTLGGFQSQFYFLLLFSLLTIWGLGLGEPSSVQWKVGAVAGVMALFTIATGFLCAAAVAGLCVMDCLKDRAKWRRHMPTFIVCCLLIAAGFLLKAHVPDHDDLQSHSVKDFLVALGHNLSWPWIDMTWYALVNIFVLALTGWICLSAPQDQQVKAERLLLMTGAWSMLQSLATAYARGAHGRMGAWRYMDLNCFLMVAGWLGIVAVLIRHKDRLAKAPFWRAGFAVWIVVSLVGLWRVADWAVQGMLPALEIIQGIRLETARAFMATDNEHVFDVVTNVNDLAYPYAPELVFMLREKDIRRILPSCVRDPLKIVSSSPDDGAFVTNGSHLDQPDPATEKCWGNYSVKGGGAAGRFEGLAEKQSAMPFLEIPVSGDLGAEAGLKLELVETATGRTTQVLLSHPPGGKWNNVYVKAPAGGFKIVASSESGSKWFAFKEPREMGRLSFWTIEVLHAWKYFLMAGMGCLLWGVLSLIRLKTLVFRPE
jgi:hypothetical protein